MTLTPSDYVDFLRSEYLSDFVKSGGSAVKFAVADDGAELRSLLRSNALAEGYVVASVDAVFSTSEVKFGIIPSVISPYVLRAIGARQARRYFQTAERISAVKALAIGLVNEVTEIDALDRGVATLVEALLSGAPQAQQAAKHLITAVNGRMVDDAVIEDTAQRIARQRATDEAKNGIASFLEKRTPAWLL